MTSTLAIRPATDADLAPIFAWLKAEYDAAGGVGFWGNRHLIARAQTDGEMFVLTGDEGILAFKIGDEVTLDILEVRPEARGLGHGRRFAEHCIDAARSAGAVVVKVECAPATSWPFWRRLGFRPIGDDDPPRLAFRLLDCAHDLPSGAVPAQVSVSLYDERVKWEPDTPPVARFEPKAARQGSEAVLAERVILYDGCFPTEGDPVVSIEVGGVPVYRDKLKYAGAKRAGLRRDPSGTPYIDRVATTPVPIDG